jgi:hypothetical protein
MPFGLREEAGRLELESSKFWTGQTGRITTVSGMPRALINLTEWLGPPDGG